MRWCGFEACRRTCLRLNVYIPLTVGHRRAVFKFFHTICALALEFHRSWTSFAGVHRCREAVDGRSISLMRYTWCEDAADIGALLEMLSLLELQKIRVTSDSGHRIFHRYFRRKAASPNASK